MVLPPCVCKTLNGEVAATHVPATVTNVRGDVLQRVEGGVERVDVLELERGAVLHAARLVELAAPEHGFENAERGRPYSDTDFGAGFGERLRDVESEAHVVRD